LYKAKFFVSILILFVIGFHIPPVIQELQGKEQTFWPFMAWGMYRKSRNPGPVWTAVTHVIGITLKGEKKPLDGNFVGLSSYALDRLYFGPMRSGDSSAAQQLADRLNLDREDPFTEFLMKRETHTITDAGIVKEDKLVLTYQVVPRRLR
jgi:hypothetical protein